MRGYGWLLLAGLVAGCGSDSVGPGGDGTTYVRLSLARATQASAHVSGLALLNGPADSVAPGAAVTVMLGATEVPAGTQGAIAMTADAPTVVGIKEDGVLIDPLSFTVGSSVPYVWSVPGDVGSHTLTGDYVDAAGQHQTVGTITVVVRDTTTPVDTTWTVTAAWDTVAVARTSAETGGQIHRLWVPILHRLEDGVQTAYYILAAPEALSVDSTPATCEVDLAWITCDQNTEGRIVVSVSAGASWWDSLGQDVTLPPSPAATVGFVVEVLDSIGVTEQPPCTRCEGP